MNKIFLFLSFFIVFSLFALDKKIIEKYAPKNIKQNEINKVLNILKDKWITNNNVSVIGSPKAKKGGTIRYALTSYPATLRTEGKNSGTVFNSIVGGLMYETLLDLDTITMEYIPYVADKWYVAKNNQVFYFHINPNARWHDGEPITAYDYVASWDFLTSDDLEEPFTAAFWKKFERPVALSKNVLKVKAKNKEWRLFLSAATMSIYPAHILINLTPKDYLKNYQNKMLVGSGPYKFKQAKTNEFIELVRVKNWWAKNLPQNRGLYNFDIIRFEFYSDDNIIIEKFKKGDLDFYVVGVARRWHKDFNPKTNKNTKILDIIRKNWVVRQRIYNERPVGIGGYAFNLKKEPFNDKRVRKAFFLLFNREKLMKKLFFNEYKYKDSYFPNSPYENPNNPKIRFDEDEAIDLLEEAGWFQDNLDDEGYLVKDGKRFEIDLDVVGNDMRVETILQQDLKNVGIKLNLKQVTWATLIKNLNQRNFSVIGINYSGSRFPNPEGMFHSKYADKLNTNNIFGFKNKRVDEICEKYNKEFDVKKRIKLLQELDYILMNEYLFALNWYSDNIRILYWNKFGVPEFGLGRFSGSNSILYYWWYDDEKKKQLTEAMKNNKPLPSEPAELKYWAKLKNKK